MQSISNYAILGSSSFSSQAAAQPVCTGFDSVLSVWDYIMLAAFLIGSAAVGIIASMRGRKADEQVDTEEFLMGGRKMSFVAVALSLLVSFNSAILILGSPAEIYSNGTMYVFSIVGEILAVVITAFVFVPVFYELRLTSSFEYLEMRFESRIVRLFGSGLLILNNVVYMALALYAPCSAMEYVTNKALPIEAIIAITGGICILYTAWGGIKAVIWSDVFQSFVMLAGVIVIIVKGLIDVKGFSNMWQVAEQYNRIEFNNFRPEPTARHTFWGLSIAVAIGYTGTFGVTQAAVQRYCSVPTLRKAQLSVIIANIGTAFFVVATCLVGLIIFAFYLQDGCDPIAQGCISTNRIVPAYVMESLSFPPFPGIFIASLFAGGMSSVSTSLSAMSAVTWQDFLKPYVFKSASDSKALWINRISIVVYGLMSILIGFIVDNLGGTVLQASLGFTGAIGAPLTALFALGILVPYADKYGAIAGAIIGTVSSLWLAIGAYVEDIPGVYLPSNITNCPTAPPTTGTTVMPTAPLPSQPPNPLLGFYSISYEWWPVFGILTTMIPAMIISLFTGKNKRAVPSNLLNPYILKLTKYFQGNSDSATVHPVEQNLEMTNNENKTMPEDLQSSAEEQTQPAVQSDSANTEEKDGQQSMGTDRRDIQS